MIALHEFLPGSGIAGNAATDQQRGQLRIFQPLSSGTRDLAAYCIRHRRLALTLPDNTPVCEEKFVT
jgi:hypothetical protein